VLRDGQADAAGRARHDPGTLFQAIHPEDSTLRCGEHRSRAGLLVPSGVAASP
jgi:hypothetical protein